jgi:two-component system CheB/CheR fusion protein
LLRRLRFDIVPKQALAPKPSIAGLSVLIVDDLEDTLAALTALLEFEAATAFTATTAGAALKLLAKNKIDVIVSDIKLPGMDGYQLIRIIREDSKFAALPAIAVTGLARPEDAELAIEAGFSAHLSKPYTFDALVETIHHLVSPG